MIPILYDADTQNFTANGLGRLSDAISCTILEERNGLYELEMQYPITGIHYDLIDQGKILYVSHDEQGDRQPFIIYRISRPINGIVVINAHHVCYELTNVIISPFTASSVTDAFNSFTTHSLTNNPFTFWTDKGSSGSFKVVAPSSCKGLLGGQEGSILDSFGGGEYKWDGYTVRLYANRGTDSGVTIRYGKNLTNVDDTVDTLDLYNGVIPFWYDEETETLVQGSLILGDGGIARSAVWTNQNNVVINDENGNEFEFAYYATKVLPMDLSDEWDEAPTVAQLQSRAQTILNNNRPWLPNENIKVDFVSLWQTTEYANVAPLERVQLCDTVTVYYPELKVNVKAKVIKVVWNALLDRYDSIELGNAKSSFADVLESAMQADVDAKIAQVPNVSTIENAIKHATDLITGGMGGHIVFLYDADGKPTDMLVMDTEDVNTAVHVLRINVNGIGFSSTGVSGTYTSAWTLDGQFVADFITAGHLSANRIQGGTLTLGGANNGNGVLVVYDGSGTEIGRWDNSGIDASGNFILSTKSGNVTYTGYVGSFTYFFPGGTTVSSTTGYGFSTQRTNYQYSVDISRAVREYIQTTSTSWSKTIFTGNASSYSALVFSVDSTNFKLYRQESSAVSSSRLSLTLGSDSTTNRTYMYIPHGQIRTSDYEIVISRDFSGSDTADLAANKPYMQLGSNVINLHCTNANTYIALTSSGANIYVSSTAYFRYNSGNWLIRGTNQSGNIAVQGSSAKRYKHDITDQIDDELDPHRLYDLTMKQFVFNDDCENWQYPDLKGRTLPGFIAEDVEEIYPAAAIHNADGEIENWDERRIIPGMLKLIQEQHDEIDDLKERVAKLETLVEKLMR